MTNILLLGCNGQVGWELQRSLAPLGKVASFGRADANLERLDALRSLIRTSRPNVIVNAAAYTAVDKSESEPERAQCVNAHAVSVLAEEALALGALMVHYSTDYVFDGGKSEPYREDDAPNPASVYGRTKLEGESAIQSSGCRYLIFRTAWVYGGHGSNFAKTILRLASEREQLRVVADQIGAPTSAELIADVTAQCLGQILCCSRESIEFTGIYHLVASGEASWHDYACFLVAGAIERGMQLKLGVDSIQAIATAEYPTPAKRPANSRLESTRLNKVFDIELPHWNFHVNRFLDEYAARRQS